MVIALLVGCGNISHYQIEEEEMKLIIRNVTGTDEGGSGKVALSYSEWGKLCDALSVSPDTSTADLIHKAELLTRLLSEARKELYKAGLLK